MPFKKIAILSIIPMLLLGWGVFLLFYLDPFSSRSIDPEFPYLINGLNFARLNFSWIGHIDHPGTPFQLFSGIVIRIVHLFLGQGEIAQDVINRPDFYLQSISVTIFLLESFLIWFIGFAGNKRGISTIKLVIVQSGFLYNDVLFWLFSRVNPDVFFIVISTLFVLIFIRYGYKVSSQRKFAILAGVVMALGFATKFNYLPILFLPLLLIEEKKNRLVYIVSGLLSFLFFVLPIIDRVDNYWDFLMKIISHDGQYGSGAERVFNFSRMIENLVFIFRFNPELILLIILLLVGLVVSFVGKTDQERGKSRLFYIGLIGILILQILIVIKHFSNYYLAPFFSILGFCFYLISIDIDLRFSRKTTRIVATLILPLLFIISTVYKVDRSFGVIDTEKKARIALAEFVERTINKDDFWFIEPTWESGPHVENGLVYGISYCGHRDRYLPQLYESNPNVITYEGENEKVKLWRIVPLELDSLIATGRNIYTYSTPGRNANKLQKMMLEAAQRNDLHLEIDTVYNDEISKKMIIKSFVSDHSSGWDSSILLKNDRQVKITNYINAIKNSPDWLRDVERKSIERKIPLDSMVLLDAIWMVDHEK